MEIGWAELTISPNEEAVAGLKREWAWLVPEPWHPLMFSVFGDVFLERQPEGVFWLNTGTGELTQVADDFDQFQAALATDAATGWFLPPLVARLHEAGKIPSTGECYSYAIFPVFAEGTYDVENLNPVPAREHFELSGRLHADLSGVPDGEQVRIVHGASDPR